ncbi:MAG: hypothetical protein HYX41_07410 [Bdellovibrio sp.]|nr:hypothetical protein [Bdellovibrio sp.]
MTDLILTVYASTTEREAQWARQLESHMRTLEAPVKVFRGGAKEAQQSQMVFVDVEIPDLKSFLFGLNRRGNAVFLVLGESNSVPKNLESLYVDDVIVAPFRAAEIESKIRFFKQMVLWNEVTELNATLSDVIKHFQSDLQLASRIHNLKMPKRFPKVKGFNVHHRYLAGLKPGGDHFDLAETKDGSCLSMVYFRSNSYGLSGAILTILMKAAVKLSQDRMGRAGASLEIVQSVYEEILVTMSPRDQVSLFFGILSRKDQKFRYVSLGNVFLAYGQPGAPLSQLPSQGGAVSKSASLIGLKEAELKMSPGSRFALFSEGFVNVAHGSQDLLGVLNQTRLEEGSACLNEMTWRVKTSPGSSEIDTETEASSEDSVLPPEDCTGVVLDMGRAIVQLAPSENTS